MIKYIANGNNKIKLHFFVFVIIVVCFNVYDNVVTFASVNVEDSNNRNSNAEKNDNDNDNNNHHNVCIDVGGNIDSTCVVNVETSNTNVTKENNNDQQHQGTTTNDNNRTDSNRTNTQWKHNQHYPVLDGCKLVMAPSSLIHPNSGWGIYSLVNISKGIPIMDGDVVIQINDLNRTNYNNGTVPVDDVLINDYLWNSEETGGYYEGINVMSAIPGIMMLGNGLPNKLHNVIPYVPTVHEGGLTRNDSPGAGSITHYHNYTFYSSKNIVAGSEIVVNYGSKWFHEHENKIITKISTTTKNTNDDDNNDVVDRNTSSNNKDNKERLVKTVDWLKQNGICLDNIKPNKSKQIHAGRGVYAKRAIPTNHVVAPAPVLVISRKDLMDITRMKDDGTTIIEVKQLLLNYCYGHHHSSILLFPYSPMVNLINHGGGKNANVKLRWSTSQILHKDGMEWLQNNISFNELKHMNHTGLLLEFVAIKPIRIGDEILFDYGHEWIKAYIHHINQWKPILDDTYAPSYVQDDIIQNLRTDIELKQYPYPDNIFTSCFYKYSDNQIAAEKHQRKKSKNDQIVTTFKWNMTRGIFEMNHLRPCNILKRTTVQNKNNNKGGSGSSTTTYFTVQIRNRFGLSLTERIPKDMTHIVTHVPRYAIRLTDKLYTTDQHLENAFRKEIGIPDDIFPEQWKDLL